MSVNFFSATKLGAVAGGLVLSGCTLDAAVEAMRLYSMFNAAAYNARYSEDGGIPVDAESILVETEQWISTHTNTQDVWVNLEYNAVESEVTFNAYPEVLRVLEQALRAFQIAEKGRIEKAEQETLREQCTYVRSRIRDLIKAGRVQEMKRGRRVRSEVIPAYRWLKVDGRVILREDLETELMQEVA
jgi:hypothetical protein